MKRETILKVILVLMVGIVLCAKPISVFAVSSNPTDLNDFWEDQGSLDDIQKEEPTTPETPKTETTEPETTTPVTPQPTTPSTSTTTQTTTPSTNTDKELPKAGLLEDTMMIVSIVALLGVAIFSFVKISDYSNI